MHIFNSLKSKLINIVKLNGIGWLLKR